VGKLPRSGFVHILLITGFPFCVIGFSYRGFGADLRQNWISCLFGLAFMHILHEHPPPNSDFGWNLPILAQSLSAVFMEGPTPLFCVNLSY